MAKERPLAFQVGSFDITKYSDNELWARMTAFSRLYSGMEEDFRLLAYSRPYPLEGAVENLRHLMAGTSDPLTRERLAAYRRFIEELVETSSLKTTNYYVLVFSGKAPRIVANTLEGGLRLPVWHRPTLPPLIRTLYREKVLHIHPADNTLDHPLIAFLYSYDVRGNVDFSIPINFLRLPCPLAMAVDVHTIHPNKVMTKLSRAYNALKADIMGKSGNEAPDAEKEQAFLDVQEAMSLVTNERAGLHQIGVGLAVMGATRDELEENVEMVHSTGTRSQISLRRAFGHQKQAMSFFLTQRVDAAIREEYRNTMSPGIACLTPFGYEVRKDIRGPFIAVNVATGSPFFLSKFNLPAYNEINLGRTGSGKTFSALLRAFRETMFGVQTIFIDPQGNGMKVTEAVDGSYNYLKLGSESAINIMDVVQENLMAQVSHVIVMLESILRRELTIEEKNGADRALVDLYSELDPTREFHPEEMPLLEDLAHRLNSLAPTLAKDLERFVDGTLRDAFNHHTTINLNLNRQYPIITYDLQDIEGEFQPTFVFALLSSIERVIRKRKHLQLPTNIILDEFGILSEIEAIAKAAGLLAKRVRAWKVGIQTLDQNWDTYRTPAGKKIVENALVKVILRVDDTVAPEICSALNLTEHHRDIMLSAGLGEGILIAENKAYHVYFQASRAELEMLTPHTRKKRSHVLDLPTARPAVAA